MADPSIGKAVLQLLIDKAQVAKDADAAITPAITGAAQNAAKLVGGLFASAKLVDFGKQGLDEYIASQKVAVQTTTQLRNVSGVTADDIDNLGQSMLDLAGFDDEAAKSAANVLLRFGAIHDTGTLQRVEQDAADLAVTMGTDLPSAAQTLGQILQDPENAARKLRPIIGSLTDAQKESIKAFTDQGDAAAAQGVILGILEERIGGAAKAYGDTLGGALDKAKENITNAKASLVEGLAPALEIGADLASTAASAIEELPGPLRTVASLAVGAGVGIVGLAQPIAGLIGSFNSLRTARLLGAAAAATDAAAIGAEAVATDVLAVNSAAAVAPLYAEAAAASTLTAALLPVALAVGAVVIAYEGLSHSHSFSIDAQKAERASLEDLTRAYDIAVGFGDQDTFVSKLAEDGEAGVGALVRLRDAMRSSGQDTSALDAAIDGARQGQENLNTSVDAGKAAFDGAATSTRHYTDEQLAAMQADLSEHLKQQAAAVDGLKQSYDGALAAQNSLIDSQLGATGADIARRDSIARQGDAYQKLADAQASGDPRKIADAQRDLERADLDVERAVAAQAKAQADAAEKTDLASGKQHDAADTARDYYDNLQSLSNTGIPEVDTALQGLIGQLEGASKDYSSRLQYQLDINGYILNPTEIQALLDQGLGLSVETLNRQAEKDRGDYLTGGAHAMGGFAPGGLPFRGGERGYELAVLGADSMYQFPADAFVVPHEQAAAAFAGKTGGGGVQIGNLTVGSVKDWPKVNVELKRLSLASRP